MVANGIRRVAEIELLTPLPAHCYDVYVYDWEVDATMGELAIPVSTAAWNDSCLTHTPPPSGMQLIHLYDSQINHLCHRFLVLPSWLSQ